MAKMLFFTSSLNRDDIQIICLQIITKNLCFGSDLFLFPLRKGIKISTKKFLTTTEDKLNHRGAL